MPEPALPAYHFQAALTPADSATYVACPFDVPSSCRSLHMRLAYTPVRPGRFRNLLTLGLFDPMGFRGHAHRGPPDAEVVLSVEKATSGFIAGPLPAGRWQAQIAVHLVQPSAAPCTYSLDITLLAGSEASASAGLGFPVQPCLSPQPGWYRGEIHAHTVHSDGSCTLAALLQHARQRKLDFIAVSDHNTVSAWSELHALACDGPLVIPATELTTFHGHAVALGIDRWVDWRTGCDDWTINDAARATGDAGGIFIIAHPFSVGSPSCTGCRWEYAGDIDMSLVDGIEVWSQRWDKADNHNPCNLKLWRELQEVHPSLAALAAADFHSPRDWGADVPVTYVYADELSVDAILAAIRQRRIMLTAGPWLELKTTKKRWVLLEDVLTAGPTQTNLVASWHDAPAGSRLRWLQHGAALNEIAVSEQGRAAIAAPPGPTHLELWSSFGALLAMTNPINAI